MHMKMIQYYVAVSERPPIGEVVKIKFRFSGKEEVEQEFQMIETRITDDEQSCFVLASAMTKPNMSNEPDDVAKFRAQFEQHMFQQGHQIARFKGIDTEYIYIESEWRAALWAFSNRG